ncbi:MAG: adenylate/guanylate cyclase domain-containing protein [Eudoraea sp.]|uniref:adenylate/guanylate cyclase domain-containing protein n=1 Tax=Eudoraea sp. TaxID=1979955 RepID=UPI00326474D8
MLSPKNYRYLRQTLTFGIIWLLFGLIYVILEYGLLGDSPIYPATGNKYDFKNALIYTSLGSFLMGLAQGWIEVTWLRKRYQDKSFWNKIFIKGTFYTILLIIFTSILTLVTNSIRFNSTVFDPVVYNSLIVFMKEFSFWSIILYAGLILDIALFYSEITTYLGNEVFYNYSFGKYIKPKQEVRIFMFLDMKSSTTIAEKIGHRKYFDLIKSYYADMTDAILETKGEIFQYVGDEIVVSWPEKKGLFNNNCIVCFQMISEVFKVKKAHYIENFGLVPEFKAGFHIGEVTTGEIGIIKKDIIYTGDALNTTARIQSECNNYGVRALISEDLVIKLNAAPIFSYTEISKLILRGKQDAIQLLAINFE